MKDCKITFPPFLPVRKQNSLRWFVWKIPLWVSSMSFKHHGQPLDVQLPDRLIAGIKVLLLWDQTFQNVRSACEKHYGVI